MSDATTPITGGCLCGALRYQAVGEPTFAGFCYCPDCRKASGGGSIGFMGFPASAVRFSGEASHFRSQALRGVATRNFCPVCGGLVFGGVVGESDAHTLYAGSLDDPSRFHPTMAIFNRGRRAWATLPPCLTVFETMPPQA